MKLFASLLCAVCFLTACNSNSKNEDQALKTKQMTIDSMEAVLAKRAIVDSMNNVMAQREEEIKAQAEEKNSQIVGVKAATATRKKKWNHTAKGAVVGAGTGAVTGALINKNHVEGALIGSLIGAGVGAGTGAIVDASKKKKSKSQQ